MRSFVLGSMAAFAVALPLGVSAVEVFYQNDFSTRESSEAIPAYNVVHEAQPYALEKTPLCAVLMMAFLSHRPWLFS